MVYLPAGSSSRQTVNAKNFASSCGISPTVSKFCRRCCISQGIPTPTLTGVTDGTGGEPRSLPDSGTLCRSYSSRLVKVVSQDLSARTSPLRANRMAMRLVSMLIAARAEK
jgi:hypothetical protein